jgi:hypothetical protein
MTNRKIVLFIVLLLTLTVTAYILLVVIPERVAENAYDGARKIGEDLRRAFQFTPSITVNNTVVIEQQASVLELATTSQYFRHRYEWVNSWMKSTKKIQIEGSFQAKAGFDLNERFTINITNGTAIVTVPAAKLLSLSPGNDIVARDENGIWNWVNEDDRNTALNAFITDAQKYAQRSPILKQAQRNLEEQLKTILKTHGKEAIIRYEQDETITPR